MNAQTSNIPNGHSAGHPTTYREAKYHGTLYRVTNVFTGEKELGPTLEKLAARRVIDEMDGRVRELLQA